MPSSFILDLPPCKMLLKLYDNLLFLIILIILNKTLNIYKLYVVLNGYFSRALKFLVHGFIITLSSITLILFFKSKYITWSECCKTFPKLSKKLLKDKSNLIFSLTKYSSKISNNYFFYNKTVNLVRYFLIMI